MPISLYLVNSMDMLRDIGERILFRVLCFKSNFYLYYVPNYLYYIIFQNYKTQNFRLYLSRFLNIPLKSNFKTTTTKLF